MLTGALFLCLLLSLIFFVRRRLLRYTRLFQQEEYNARRFVAWVWTNRAFDTRGLAAATLALISCFLPRGLGALAPCLAGTALFTTLALWETDPRRQGKLRLIMTDRVTRIFRLALLFLGAGLAALAVLGCHALSYGSHPLFWLGVILWIQTIPFSLVAANLCLQPGETKRQNQYLAEAKNILRTTHPTVIGITGSYGKTSTKMILNDMLSMAAPTFTLGRSINTVMGITKEIRERLKPGHRYAVIEMGAYQRGSIQRLCDLAPPQAGIITAVGVMHLERFGSPENVFAAKAELAQAVPAEGILVCNGDDANSREIARRYPKRQTLLYGFNREQPLDCYMSDVRTTETGSTFVIHWQGQELAGTTGLHGRPMLSNILAAFTMSCALGHDPRVMLAVVASMDQVENRLQIKRVTVQVPGAEAKNGSAPKASVVELRDAYNSNPVGFAAALDELERMPGTRKILITPGMVELGDRQPAENERLALRAASVCQLVIIVGKTNAEALRAGLQKGGLPEPQIRFYEGRDEAFAALRRAHADGDVVLIENDLPDLYEGSASF